MITINSISGGKTSSYMAYHNKANYNIFALVRIEAEYCKIKDRSIVKYVSDKIGMDFIATAESDKTLYLVRDLEQKIGQEVIWVTGKTFEEVIFKRKALPNQMWRFCTTEMKLQPMFDWWKGKFYPEPINVNIGFRYDEIDRGFERIEGKWVQKETEPFKYVVGKTANGKNKWGSIIWEKPQYPLISNVVTHFEVKKWADESGLIFPPDSNCVGCFWKNPMQLRKNFEEEPNKMRWFVEMEGKMKRRFKKEISYKNILKLGLQLDFNYGMDLGCKAGRCGL